MEAFKKLSFDDKISVLNDNAQFLTLLERKNVYVALLKLDDFYLDVYYRKCDSEMILIRPFKSVKRLYKYKLSHKEFGKLFIKLS